MVTANATLKTAPSSNRIVWHMDHSKECQKVIQDDRRIQEGQKVIHDDRLILSPLQVPIAGVERTGLIEQIHGRSCSLRGETFT